MVQVKVLNVIKHSYDVNGWWDFLAIQLAQHFNDPNGRWKILTTSDTSDDITIILTRNDYRKGK